MSIFTKSLFIGLFSLLLLIPLLMMTGIVEERKSNAHDATIEVSEKWGKEQAILPPMLRIPYDKITKEQEGVQTDYVWITPKSLNITAEATTQIRKRSIYKIPVYVSELKLSGEWDMSILKEEYFKVENLRLDEAEIVLGIHDVKGIKDYVYVKVDGQSIGLRSNKNIDRATFDQSDEYSYTNTFDESASALSPPITSGALLSGAFPLQKTQLEQKFSFTSEFTFTGSRTLQFAPIARSNEINLKSNWAHPSFIGSFLPETSEVRPDGFDAKWSVVEYNRGYGNLLADKNISSVMASSASVSFIQPVNEYSQTERTIKYGILVILLSFVSIFFIEMSLKRLEININLFHYMLSGLALVLFYTLLLSMSEIVGFGWAYLIASIMTISLIGLYFRSILPTPSSALILVGILAFLYLFIYLLIQLTTYALLVGSLGLFSILALVMYVSSKLIK